MYFLDRVLNFVYHDIREVQNMDNNSNFKASSTTKKGKDYKAEQQKQSYIEEILEEDNSTFYVQANLQLDKTNYHRGISIETLDRFNVGFMPEWRHPKAPNSPATPRLIIPTSPTSYLARDTRKIEDIPEEQQKFTKSKVGKTHIFNAIALKNADKPIFVVEGELDALSIIDVHGEAIALGSVSMVNTLLDQLEKEKAKPAHTLILALDHDNAGEGAKIQLIKGLERLYIPFQVAEPYKNFKDANEALMTDKAGFSLYVAKWENCEKEKYIKDNATSSYIDSFLDGVHGKSSIEAIPTGFKNLDKFFEGGLYEGLYIIGALTSQGKTTYTMQIASQIAQSGHDVLIFALEMSRNELIAKMISRHTAQLALEKGLMVNEYGKTTRGIQVGAFYKTYTPSQIEHINDSVEELRKYAGHIVIVEGLGNIGIVNIMATIEKHKKALGRTPVVIIDYLQILAPYNERWTEKQNTDKAIIELKRLSRDNKTPIIAISSFNRSNYQTEAQAQSFKESGGIEYSSDVLLGLQLKGTGQKDFNFKAANDKSPREMELLILKNRNGRMTKTIEYKYYSAYNYFVEA